jgi:hypothetical protein
VEGVLYNINTLPFQDTGGAESKAQVEIFEGQELYGNYGQCSYCLLSTWLLSYLAESYKKDQPLGKDVNAVPKKKRKSITESI